MFEKYLPEGRNMALCLVCDLSSMAAESMGEVCFKEKTTVPSFFPVCTQATEKSAVIQDTLGPKNQSRNP